MNTEIIQNLPKDGGLGHINVKHFVHSLRTKWMVRLWEDGGLLWSALAWE